MDDDLSTGTPTDPSTAYEYDEDGSLMKESKKSKKPEGPIEFDTHVQPMMNQVSNEKKYFTEP